MFSSRSCFCRDFLISRCGKLLLSDFSLIFVSHNLSHPHLVDLIFILPLFFQPSREDRQPHHQRRI
jgi:hypothetical protein